MTAKQIVASDARGYAAFVASRDRALEQVLFKARTETSDIMNAFLETVLSVVTTHYPHASIIEDRLKNSIAAVFAPAFAQIVRRMKKTTYGLAKRSEGEALAQAGVKDVQVDLRRDELADIDREESVAGGPLHDRIAMYLNRIARDAASAVEQAHLLGDDLPAARERVAATFPKPKVVKRPRRVLAGFAEADKKPTPIMSAGIIDDADWAEIVDDYSREYLPKFRGPEAVIDLWPKSRKSADEDVWYAWELERDLTQEFVQNVRDGQIDAANENGINDFVWIAIIDDVTDECCRWRDGLTTSEIRSQLKGAHKNDECKATAPPAHFNCRCTLAPMLREADLQPPESNLAEFDEWLRAA